MERLVSRGQFQSLARQITCGVREGSCAQNGYDTVIIMSSDSFSASLMCFQELMLTRMELFQRWDSQVLTHTNEISGTERDHHHLSNPKFLVSVSLWHPAFCLKAELFEQGLRFSLLCASVALRPPPSPRSSPVRPLVRSSSSLLLPTRPAPSPTPLSPSAEWPQANSATIR